MAESSWSARAARARHQADRRPEAAELLTFYAALVEHQHTISERWAGEVDTTAPPSALRQSIDADWVVDAIPDLLSWLERSAPPRLAAAAASLRGLRADDWHEQLDEVLSDRDGDAAAGEPQRFVVEALLQPIAETLAARAVVAPVPDRPRCPFCQSRPVVGALREEGHGAKRLLICALCSSAWTFLRLVCPACGERQFETLPVYTAEQSASVRIEACDSCRTYIKTIDQTRDGLAVPAADDIATVALDIWARGQGYVRLRANVLRA